MNLHIIENRRAFPRKVQKVYNKAINQSIRLALENNCKSIAVPAISCGSYGYPIKEAAEVILSACQDFTNQLDIHFYLYSISDYEVWNKVYLQLQE